MDTYITFPFKLYGLNSFTVNDKNLILKQTFLMFLLSLSPLLCDVNTCELHFPKTYYLQNSITFLFWDKIHHRMTQTKLNILVYRRNRNRYNKSTTSGKSWANPTTLAVPEQLVSRHRPYVLVVARYNLYAGVNGISSGSAAHWVIFCAPRTKRLATGGPEIPTVTTTMRTFQQQHLHQETT